ncbi:hypothetical protein [Sorangium sp. So ce1024]|uniref:hypothetical protein n=1 Tax=unclassified Sorangium TaxID=2621164 RepID=UPI003F0729F1
MTAHDLSGPAPARRRRRRSRATAASAGAAVTALPPAGAIGRPDAVPTAAPEHRYLGHGAVAGPTGSS